MVVWLKPCESRSSPGFIPKNPAAHAAGFFFVRIFTAVGSVPKRPPPPLATALTHGPVTHGALQLYGVSAQCNALTGRKRLPSVTGLRRYQSTHLCLGEGLGHAVPRKIHVAHGRGGSQPTAGLLCDCFNACTGDPEALRCHYRARTLTRGRSGCGPNKARIPAPVRGDKACICAPPWLPARKQKRRPRGRRLSLWLPHRLHHRCMARVAPQRPLRLPWPPLHARASSVAARAAHAGTPPPLRSTRKPAP